MPNNFKDFKSVRWEISNENEFQKDFPSEYESLLDYKRRKNIENSISSKIRKTDIDVYNRGIKNVLVSVDTEEYRRNYLLEPDYVRLGFKKIFDDESSNSNPFSYKGQIFFAHQYVNGLEIIEFIKQPQGHYPYLRPCKYTFNRQE